MSNSTDNLNLTTYSGIIQIIRAIYTAHNGDVPQLNQNEKYKPADYGIRWGTIADLSGLEISGDSVRKRFYRASSSALRGGVSFNDLVNGIMSDSTIGDSQGDYAGEVQTVNPPQPISDNGIFADSNYLVSGDYIIFNTPNYDILPVSEVSEMWADYCQYGGNMTVAAICEKHGVMPELFGSVRRILRFNKHSPLEYLNESELSEAIATSSRNRVWDAIRRRSAAVDQRTLATAQLINEGVYEPYLEGLSNPIGTYTPIAKVPYVDMADAVNYTGVFTAFCDLHYNKTLFDNSQTNEELEELFFRCMKDTFNRFDRMGVRRIVVPIFGDTFNTDNLKGHTTGSTPQRNNLPIKEAALDFGVFIQKATNMIVDHFDEVHFVITPGNHDEYTASLMGVGLYVRFKETPNVTVHNVACDAHYIMEIPGCVLLLSHGENIKDIKMWTKVISNEADQEMLARCDLRIAVLQHLHHLRMHQDRDTFATVGMSLSIADDWHKSKGFTSRIGSCVMLIAEDGSEFTNTMLLYNH